MLFVVFVIVHSLCWAAWFGAGITASGDILRTLPMDQSHRDELLGRMRAWMQVWIVAANATLWSGVLLVLVKFGYREIPPGMFVKLGLTLATFVVGIAFLKPALKQFAAALSDSNDEVMEASANRFRRLVWLEKSIILTVVVLTMFGKAYYGG